MKETANFSPNPLPPLNKETNGMKTIRKDMSRREFDAACSRRGFIPTGVLGYYRITDNVSVSVFNCGVSASYREMLKYLIAQHKKAESEQ